MNDNTLFSLVKFIPIAKYRRNLREKIRARQQARILAAQTANLRDEASSIPHKEESDLKQYSEWRFDLDTNKNYFIKEASDRIHGMDECCGSFSSVFWSLPTKNSV